MESRAVNDPVGGVNASHRPDLHTECENNAASRCDRLVVGIQVLTERNHSRRYPCEASYLGCVLAFRSESPSLTYVIWKEDEGLS
jgi:hypothetical protein